MKNKFTITSCYNMRKYVMFYMGPVKPTDESSTKTINQSMICVNRGWNFPKCG